MADTFDLTEVIEVSETRDYGQVNESLKAGWKLISTHTRAFGDPNDGQQTIYCLGWTKDQGDPPKGKYDGI